MNHNANLQSRDIDHEVRGVCVPEVSQIVEMLGYVLLAAARKLTAT